MRPLRSPHERTRLVTDRESIARGREMARECRVWMELNEDSFRAIHGFLRGLMARGVKGRTRDRVALFCTSNNIDVGDDEHAFRNGKWAGISRYMALYDPALAECGILKFNDSVIDCYGLLPVSWMPGIGDRA